MKISPEEINVITAGLRRFEITQSNLVQQLKAEGRMAEAKMKENSERVARTLADKFAEPGRTNFEYRDSEHRFLIAVLKVVGLWAGGVADSLRARMLYAESDQQRAFAEACKAIAEKWQRESPRGGAALLH